MRLKVSNVCQLYDKTYLATQTVNGVTFTNNGDGSVTVNGTASNTATAEGEFLRVNPGDIILMFSGYDIIGLKTAYVYCSQWDENKKWIADLGYPSLLGRISTCGKNCRYIRYTYRVDTGNTATNAVIKLQMFNLTEMYGIGNEPTTVEQFRQDFPDEMYDYNPECWKKFRRLKYIANKQPVQLLDKSKFKNGGEAGITATVDISTGIWTITGTATTRAYIRIEDLIVNADFNVGDKLFLRNSNIDNANYWPYAASYDINRTYLREQDGEGLFTIGENTHYLYVWFNVIGDKTINTTTQFQLFNLTRMYGKGNEPTAAEFVAQYSGFDYPVNKYNYLTLNRGKFIANKEPIQLLDKSQFRETFVNNGMTFANNSDGTFTLNGTTTSASGSSIYLRDSTKNIVKANHKYLMTGFPIAFNGSNYVYFQYYPYSTTIKYYILNNSNGYLFFTPAYDGERWNIFYNFRTAGFTIDNVTIKPQLFDLTEMFGSGHEPTTVEQFRADYPNELYDYNPYNAITFR